MPTKAQIQTAEKRRNEAMRLREAGYSYQVIADQLGVSKATIVVGIQRTLAEDRPKEEVETVRKLQMQRYERSLAAIWTDVVKGDLETIVVALRILARIDKITGVEAKAAAEINIENLDARTQVLIADGGDARELLADRVLAYLERAGPLESPNGPAELTAGNGAAGPV